MNTVQRGTNRTIHVRPRDTGAGPTAGYSRTLQRSAPPVIIRPQAVQVDNAESTVSSETLLRGAKTVHITHNGETYQLRATRHGKLILTK